MTLKISNGKFLLLCVLITFISKQISAQYKPVDEGSSVQFKIKNFGINTSGYFKGLQGSISFDNNNPENSVFDVSVEASTINTANELRDNHLRGETYFDVNKFPKIHFVSSKIKASVNKGEFLMSGRLTIKYQTKDIAFPFTAAIKDDAVFFKGSFTINRKDFGIGGASVISDELQVELNVVAKK